MKKHVTQFEKDDAGWIAGFVRQYAVRIRSSKAHFYDRATARDISAERAREAVKCGLPIEIHDNSGEWRAVFRDREGICVVISIETFEMITAWYNDPTDNHRTLNVTPYHGGNLLNVPEIIKSLVSRA